MARNGAWISADFWSSEVAEGLHRWSRLNKVLKKLFTYEIEDAAPILAVVVGLEDLAVILGQIVIKCIFNHPRIIII